MVYEKPSKYLVNFPNWNMFKGEFDNNKKFLHIYLGSPSAYEIIERDKLFLNLEGYIFTRGTVVEKKKTKDQYYFTLNKLFDLEPPVSICKFFEENKREEIPLLDIFKLKEEEAKYLNKEGQIRRRGHNPSYEILESKIYTPFS